MTYKIGDKVKIREWDDLVEEYGIDRGYIPVHEGICINTRMKDYCGKETTISFGLNYNECYELEIDGKWFWPVCALLPVEEKEPVETEDKAVKYNIGDKVKIREWDDLVEEYGVDYRGHIHPPKGTAIVPNMKDDCGKETTILSGPDADGDYKLAICAVGYFWPESALLPVETDATSQMPKEQETEKKVVKYNIGDKVKIREWDDLAEECGVDYRGFIRVNEGICISTRMKDYCGKETTILSGPDASGNYKLAIREVGYSLWPEYALLPAEAEKKAVKYKIGDKVKTREWDDLVAEYGVDHKGNIRPEEGIIISHMKDYCGKEAEVRFRPNFNGSYKLEIDGKYYLWPACALLPVEENVAKYKIGDKVKIREWDEMVEEYGLDRKGIIRTPTVDSRECIRPKEGATIIPHMKDKCGKETTILSGPDSNRNYRLAIDGARWSWSECALLPVEEDVKYKIGDNEGYYLWSERALLPAETEKKEMKYKVGDKVRIRTWNDLAQECGVEQNGNIYPPEGVVIVSRMKEHCGKETTIKELDPSGNYRLEVDDACCLWPEFALLEENNGKYKVGDKVRIREWDDLVEEYGLDHRGGIHQGEGVDIVPRMKDYCGEETVILSGPDTDGDYNLAIDGGRYFWSEYALLPVEEKDAKYNIGDKVKIREWDEMAQEFRVDVMGNLRPREGATIIPCMKNNCGKETTILRGPNSDGNYELAIDGGRCFWPECALFPVSDEPVVKVPPKKIAYISGLIAGVNDDRSHAKAVLMRNGYSVINPTELRNSVLPEEASLEDYLDVCLLLIEKADVLVQLPGWEAGAAANRELGYAKGLGKEIIKLGDIEKDRADK